MKTRLYKSTVRPILTYGSEDRPKHTITTRRQTPVVEMFRQNTTRQNNDECYRIRDTCKITDILDWIKER